ncbi:MAG TPA: HXXEE domain-containing protein [Pyrinomonadaceae bacterium]|nr:HXXEE domain-containing protein [Pyrinomonadaceae bacterium]
MRGRAQTQAGGETWPAAWGWLFPATYALHILEELWGGEGFTAWLARVAVVELASARFLVWNALALLLMAAGVVLALRFKNLRWLLVAYAVAFLLNALSHLAASFYTVSYSPGLVSSLLLWLPLAALTLLRFRKTLSRRQRRAGLVVGLLMHCAVLALTLLGERLNF